jgi:hypothetical protein
MNGKTQLIAMIQCARVLETHCENALNSLGKTWGKVQRLQEDEKESPADSIAGDSKIIRTELRLSPKSISMHSAGYDKGSGFDNHDVEEEEEEEDKDTDDEDDDDDDDDDGGGDDKRNSNADDEDGDERGRGLARIVAAQ